MSIPVSTSTSRRLAVPAALVLVAIVLVVVQSRHHEEIVFAPGENTQLDYVLSLPHVPAQGEPLSPAAVPPGVDPTTLPDGPYSYAGSTPPAYYVVTAVVARPIAAVTGWSPLAVARAVGALWLAGFLLVAYALARTLQVPRLTAAATATAVASTLSVATSAVYLGSDLAGAVAGGLVILAACRYDGARRALLWLVAAAALAGLTKLTAVTAVVVAVVVLTVRAPARALVGAAACVLAFAAPTVLWVVRTRETAERPYSAIAYYAPYVAEHIDWWPFPQSLLFSWYSPVSVSWAQPLLRDRPDLVLTWVFGALLALGALAAALGSGAGSHVALGGVGLGVGLLVTVVLGPLAFMQADFVLNGLVMPVEARHAYALLPGLTAAAALLMRDRAGGWAMVGLTVAAFANLLT